MTKKYISYEKDKVLEFDDADNKAKVIDLAEVTSEIAEIQKRIKELEEVLADNKRLLLWAVEYYPYSSGLIEFRNHLEILQALDGAIKEASK